MNQFQHLNKEMAMSRFVVTALKIAAFFLVFACMYFGFWGRWKLAIAMLFGVVVLVRSSEWFEERLKTKNEELEETYDY